MPHRAWTASRRSSHWPWRRPRCTPTPSATSRRTARAHPWAIRSKSRRSPARTATGGPSGTASAPSAPSSPTLVTRNAAAGVTGLIKAVQALRHGQKPPSLNFVTPNPEIDFENSPFFVNTELLEWPVGETPRRAGVSSFGVGGTNAHVILEEAPPGEPSGHSRPWQLLRLSAKNATGLERVH